ncbi:MAG: universal stress protein [Anaerolineae bacterium]|nr:universal stress protein [Anaerolineae bacterium]
MVHSSSTAGQLHIFFGAAPGVGKTWAMVDAAQERRSEGVDVVIGLVDAHDRPEFTELLDGLEVIPLHDVEYQSVHLKEIDLNAILRRHPQIVLIDDLAHSNVPGTRNAKRYQDVIELLQAGISVYTTMNVQHVSSVAQAVEEITGIAVREQVPDVVLEMATSIRLVDLDPEELLNRLSKRLKASKTGTLQHREIDDFFKPATLVTLRELALRVAANRIDEDVQRITPLKPRVDAWSGSSRIMVGISSSPSNERLLRATHQLADELHTTWLAVHVQLPDEAQLGREAQDRIKAHLHLAKELGAEILIVAGEKIADTLVNVAAQYDVSRVVVGRTRRKRGMLWGRLSLAEEIMERSATLDILILR